MLEETLAAPCQHERLTLRLGERGVALDLISEVFLPDGEALSGGIGDGGSVANLIGAG